MRRSWYIAAVLVVLPVLTLCVTPAPKVAGPGPGGGDTLTGHDWTRFGWDAGRSNASTAPTGIDASNVGSMIRQQVHLSGTVDASAIYLSDVQVSGGAHNVFFVTTTYGKTIAVDADSGTILWTYTPAAYSSWVGSAQITTSTPVSDPDRQFLYAASPDGHIQKLAVADGHAAWSTAITSLPQREKIASSLNYFAGRIIATTGGYVGDAPPYQGHVAIVDAGSGQLLHVWNSALQRSARRAHTEQLSPERIRDLGTCGRGDRFDDW